MKNKTEKTKVMSKRLNIDIPEEMHKKLKILALEKNITLRMLILRTLIKMLNTQQGYN